VVYEKMTSCILTALCLTGATAFADTVLINSGSWTNAAIWSPSVPVSGEITDVSGGHTVTVDNGSVAECGRISIYGAASIVLPESGGTLSTCEVRLGLHSGGLGTIEIHGGALNTSSHFQMGYNNVNTRAIVNMTGGRMTVNGGSFRVPYQGTAIINLSGGVITSKVDIVLGHYHSSQTAKNGVINQSGGSVVCTKSVIVGKTLSATNIVYNISGGSLSAAESLTVGAEAEGGIGKLRVSGTESSITARDVAIGTNGVYEVCLVNGAASTIVAQGGNETQNIILNGVLNVRALDNVKTGNFQLFRMDGSGQIVGQFDSVVWNDGLSGKVIYKADEVRLLIYKSGTILSIW